MTKHNDDNLINSEEENGEATITIDNNKIN